MQLFPRILGRYEAAVECTAKLASMKLEIWPTKAARRVKAGACWFSRSRRG